MSWHYEYVNFHNRKAEELLTIWSLFVQNKTGKPVGGPGLGIPMTKEIFFEYVYYVEASNN